MKLIFEMADSGRMMFYVCLSHLECGHCLSWPLWQQQGASLLTGGEKWLTKKWKRREVSKNGTQSKTITQRFPSFRTSVIASVKPKKQNELV